MMSRSFLLLSCLILSLPIGCSQTTSVKLVVTEASDVPVLKKVDVAILIGGVKHTSLDLSSVHFPGEILISNIPSTVTDFRVFLDGLDANNAVVAEAAIKVVPVPSKILVVPVELTAGRLADGDADGIPDVVDDCPGVADPQQTGGCNADLGFPDLSGVAIDMAGPVHVTSVNPPSGRAAPGGSSVTVTGDGFLPGASVTFGGVALDTVVVQSATSLTGITRHHAAGKVAVVVTNPDSTSGTLANAYEFVPLVSSVILDDMEHAAATVPSTNPVLGGSSWSGAGPMSSTITCSIDTNSANNHPGGGNFLVCQGQTCSFGPQIQLYGVADITQYDAIKFWAQDVAGATTHNLQALYRTGGGSIKDYKTAEFAVPTTWTEFTFYFRDLIADQYSRPPVTLAETLQNLAGFQIQGGAPTANTCGGADNYKISLDDFRVTLRSTLDDFQDGDTVPIQQLFTPAEGPGTWTSSTTLILESTTNSVADASVDGGVYVTDIQQWAKLDAPSLAPSGNATATLEIRPRSGGQPQLFDASAHVGFSYRAKSSTTTIVKALITDVTHPLGGYATSCTITPGWSTCKVDFSTLTGLDPGAIYGLVFEIDNLTASAKSMDVELDNVQLTWP